MKATRKFEAWRASEIVKLLLLSSGFSRVVPNPKSQGGFVAVSDQLLGQLLAVEVKAGAHPAAQLLAWTQQWQREHTAARSFLLAVVDAKQEEGFFTVVGAGHDLLLQPLTKTDLEKAFYSLAA